jgi:hypothetical protein
MLTARDVPVQTRDHDAPGTPQHYLYAPASESTLSDVAWLHLWKTTNERKKQSTIDNPRVRQFQPYSPANDVAFNANKRLKRTSTVSVSYICTFIC